MKIRELGWGDGLAIQSLLHGLKDLSSNPWNPYKNLGLETDALRGQRQVDLRALPAISLAEVANSRLREKS